MEKEREEKKDQQRNLNSINKPPKFFEHKENKGSSVFKSETPAA